MQILLNYFQWLVLHRIRLAYTVFVLQVAKKSEYKRLPALEPILAGLPRWISYINYNYLILVYHGMRIGSETCRTSVGCHFGCGRVEKTLNLVCGAICDNVYHHKKKYRYVVKINQHRWYTAAISLIFGGRWK